jgi:D-glycero-beta-D-manno-heptose-7-phosphate kinase
MHNILKNISHLNVLVIGDVMLDHYIWGNVQRISPEAPVPVVEIKNETFATGGASNVAANLASVGAKVTLLGSVGCDKNGRKIKQLIKKQGVDLVEQNSDTLIGKKTITKTRIIAHEHQICRLDEESSYNSYNILNTSNADYIDSLITKSDGVIISDYAKGVVSENLISFLKKYRKNKFICIDPKPKKKLQFNGFTLLTPNKAEACKLAEMNESNLDILDLHEVSNKIQKKYNPKYLVVTLGHEGMALFKNGKLLNQIKSKAKEVYDVSGAGDTVISVLSACLMVGESFEKSAEIANNAAGVVVTKLGTTVIEQKDLLNFKLLNV